MTTFCGRPTIRGYTPAAERFSPRLIALAFRMWRDPEYDGRCPNFYDLAQVAYNRVSVIGSPLSVNGLPITDYWSRKNMRIKVILNPWADRGRGIQRKETIESLGREHGGLDLVVTQRPKQAHDLALQAADEGYDVVVAAGGDGTIHEVVNGLVASHSQTKLGVLPIGSGNDFAYAMGIPTDLALAVPRLFNGTTRTIDLARIEDARGHYQIVDNNIGIGFDAMVVVQTEVITRVHGFLMYFIAVLRTIAFYYQTPHLEIRFDDEEAAQEVLFLAMGVGQRSGGGFFLTPDARYDDNLVDSCLVNPIGRLTMLGMLQQAIKGTHIHSRHVTMRQSRQISLRANMPLPIHVDGEMFAYPQDDVRHVTITSLPAALQVIT